MCMKCSDLVKPKLAANDCDLLECWCFPDPTPNSKKVKVLNKKYCWLYPERDVKKLKKLLPCFDDCKTLYTQCDYKVEACVHEQILKIEDELREFQKVLNIELRFQNKLIDEMWKQSQRHMRLVSGGVCVKLYPEIVSLDAEHRALCEFQRKLKALNISNCRMAKSLGIVTDSITELNHRCGLLDMTVESIYLRGNHYQRPLAYVRGLIDDLYKYFYSVLCKLKSWAQLLDPGDPTAIEDYKALLQPSNEFAEFMAIGMQPCGCFRTKNPDCIHDYVNKCVDCGKVYLE